MWLLDYQAMNTKRKTGSVVAPKQEQVPFDTLEDAKTAIDEVQKSDKQVKLEPANETEIFPLTVEVARLKLKITRNESEATFKVEPVVTEQEVPLVRQIIGQINKGIPFRRLNLLLVSSRVKHISLV